MSLSQMDFIDSSLPGKAMNNDIYVYLWRNEIFEVSALRHCCCFRFSFFPAFICKHEPLKI